MGLLIFCIILTVIAFVALGIDWVEETFSFKLRQFFCVAGFVPLLFGCFTIIPANTVGIVYNTFTGTSQETLTEGFHQKSIFDRVYEFNTQTQTVQVNDLTTQTKDAQYVTSQIIVKYKVNEENAYKVFKQFKELDVLSERLIAPSAQRVLETVTTTYNVIDILGEKKNEVYGKIDTLFVEELAAYGVDFVAITISDMDAGAEIENAITAEAVAKKAVETAEQNLLKAETEAKQKSVQAKAEQEAAIIEAETKLIEAEATKKANELLNQTMSDEILQKLWIEKWDGKMPTYYGSDANLMITPQ